MKPGNSHKKNQFCANTENISKIFWEKNVKMDFQKKQKTCSRKQAANFRVEKNWMFFTLKCHGLRSIRMKAETIHLTFLVSKKQLLERGK